MIPGLGYMRRQPGVEQTHITEPYVSSPPALVIVDERGDIWTLGLHYRAAPRGEFAFDVLKNGIATGEFASRIERRNGRTYIFGHEGRKVWTGKTFV